MPLAKKNSIKRTTKKTSPTVVVVTKSQIKVKDTLFPEKLARAKKILGSTKFLS